MNSTQMRRALEPLKDFQRDTVEYVFKRLYTDPEPTRRFLVADEVGLGKTMVARGVIAKAVEHLRDKVARVDVVYVCSNAAIARQNLERLDVSDGPRKHFETRLTLLARQVGELAKQPVNFVSFTPGTTFDLKSRAGRADERVMLYFLLTTSELAAASPARNLLRGNVGVERWKSMLTWANSEEPIDDTLRAKFARAIRRDQKLHTKLDDVLDRFKRHRDNIPAEDGSLQYEVIGSLRLVLARCCIDALEPDLVVLDEFQRFRDLLTEESEAGSLAQQLFEYSDARVLLLSATPYKMLTLDDESERHEEDFVRTYAFLAQDNHSTTLLRDALARYRAALLVDRPGRLDTLRGARDEVQQLLLRVMCRTERVRQTRARDAMLREVIVPAPLVREDLRQAVLADSVSRALGTGDIVEYWKSTPHLLSFMRDYILGTELRDRAKKPPEGLVEALYAHRDLLLRSAQVAGYESLPQANARLRAVAAETLDRGQWRWLWLPPSVPYIAPTNRYANADAAATKTLLFSAWNACPDAIATLLSYEAERRAVEAARQRDSFTYEQFGRRRRPLLNFRAPEGRGPAGMPVLALLYPSKTLATHVDPLALALDLGDGRPADLVAVRAGIAGRFQRLIHDLETRYGGDESDRSDERWYWAFGPLLDMRGESNIAAWVDSETGLRGLYGGETEEESGDDESRGESGYQKHLDLLLRVMKGQERLGPMPHDLLEVVADLALAAPAVCAARALLRVCGFDNGWDDAAASSAAAIAKGFRVLFNVPETIALLRGEDTDDEDAGRDPYWRTVLRYCVEGNLQAVLDEYAHLLVESTGSVGKAPETIAENVADAMTSALSPRTSMLTVRGVKPRPKLGRVEFDDFRVRCRFALRFGEIREEGSGEVTRAETVRDAFNSPFRPFVLASTSIGQEGLDFHAYCHAVHHWNLPTNPVDLEQREGRVHRYKGHAVRRNVARAYGLPALRHQWSGEGDPWARLFELASADRPAGANMMHPYWIFETEGGVSVERRVPVLPLSREVTQLAELKRQLALYRLVFGQPRQQDLLTHLANSNTSPEEVDEVAIDLTPPSIA